MSIRVNDCNGDMPIRNDGAVKRGANNDNKDIIWQQSGSNYMTSSGTRDMADKMLGYEEPLDDGQKTAATLEDQTIPWQDTVTTTDYYTDEFGTTSVTHETPVSGEVFVPGESGTIVAPGESGTISTEDKTVSWSTDDREYTWHTEDQTVTWSTGDKTITWSTDSQTDNPFSK